MRLLVTGALAIALSCGTAAYPVHAEQFAQQAAVASNPPNCIEWARGPTVSEDRRLIGIFSNTALKPYVYQTFNPKDPPIKGFGDTSRFSWFDMPKDEFETTTHYLERRRTFWSRLLGEDGNVVHIGHRRLEFTYDADAQSMRVNSNFSERTLSIGDGPNGIAFSDNVVQTRNRLTVITKYFVQTFDDLFGRMEEESSSRYASYQPLTIPMDGEAARDVNASGFIKLKLSFPVFRSATDPVAMHRWTDVTEMRGIVRNNSIFADLECAVLVTAGKRYYDLLAVK